MQVGSGFRFKTWPQRLQTLSDKAITTVPNRKGLFIIVQLTGG